MKKTIYIFILIVLFITTLGTASAQPQNPPAIELEQISEYEWVLIFFIFFIIFLAFIIISTILYTGTSLMILNGGILYVIIFYITIIPAGEFYAHRVIYIFLLTVLMLLNGLKSLYLFKEGD